MVILKEDMILLKLAIDFAKILKSILMMLLQKVALASSAFLLSFHLHLLQENVSLVLFYQQHMYFYFICKCVQY